MVENEIERKIEHTMETGFMQREKAKLPTLSFQIL